MKTAGILAMSIALLVAPIAGACCRCADLPIVRNDSGSNEEQEEKELRRLLIERLKQENQSCSRNERAQSQEANSSSGRSIIEKIKEMPWWGWVVGGIGLVILGKVFGD